jgi:hypothetical protein
MKVSAAACTTEATATEATATEATAVGTITAGAITAGAMPADPAAVMAAGTREDRAGAVTTTRLERLSGLAMFLWRIHGRAGELARARRPGELCRFRFVWTWRCNAAAVGRKQRASTTPRILTGVVFWR